MNETCGCCEGIDPQTPVTIINRPGLAHLAYRVGTHARFMETMRSHLSSWTFKLPPGHIDPHGDPSTRLRPLRGLTTRQGSDPAIALLDAWATVAAILTFYQERIANEGYLRTATERRSILELARLLGYTLRPGVAASVFLAYTLDQPVASPTLPNGQGGGAAIAANPPASQSVIIPAGSRAQSVPGPGELPQTFETSDALEARAEWNTLKPRLTRPQNQFMPPPQYNGRGSGNGAGAGGGGDRSLYFKGITTNLKPNDPLLVVDGGTRRLYRVLEVKPDAAADRTQVVYQDWAPAQQALLAASAEAASSEREMSEGRTPALAATVEGIVVRFGDTEALELNARNRTVQVVMDLIERLRARLAEGISDDELRTLLTSDIVPTLRDQLALLDPRRATRIVPWLRDLVAAFEKALEEASARRSGSSVEAMTAAALGAPVSSTMSTSSYPPTPPSGTTSITSVLDALTKPRSVPPPNNLRLPQSLDNTLKGGSDAIPRLLTAARPDLAPLLYNAWANVPATEPSTAQVYALRLRASPFGHNAPPDTIRNERGVPTGTQEWRLWKVDRTQKPEDFEIIVTEAIESATGHSPFETVIKVGAARSERTPVKQGPFDIVLPGDIEHVSVTLTQENDNTKQTLRYRFAKRRIVVTIIFDSFSELPQYTVTSEGSDPTTVFRGFISDSTSPDLSGFVITVQGWLYAGRVPTEQSDVIALDTTYPTITPSGASVDQWIVVERPTPLSGGQRVLIRRVVSVSERSRADYGITGKSTHVELDQDWIELEDNPDTFAVIRGTTVYAQSELMELAEAPMDPVVEAICGDGIELDRLYEGLKPGRWLIVSGERTDVQEQNDTPGSGSPLPDGIGRRAANGTSSTAVRVGGVPGTELVMLAGVEQTADTEPGGKNAHTRLRLAKPLSYCYKRDSVTIYGNVVKATHGETRSETLGNGDGSKPNQTFVLKQAPLTYVSASTPSGIESTLTVRVNDVRWRAVDSLSDLSSTDRGYITRTDDEGKTTVLFGNGREGARLPTGQENVKAVYRTGIGAAGNVLAGQISLLSTRPLGVSGVINPLPATGGADKESRDEARRNAPLAVTALDRLVSIQDYADFARTFAGIGKASAALLSDGRREVVHLTIAGAKDIPIDADSDLYRHLREALYRFGDPFQPVEIAIRRLRLLVIEARVRLDPDYLWEAVAPKIRAALLDTFSFDRRDFGQDVLRSEVIHAMHSVPGVVYVDIDKLDTVDEDTLKVALAPTPQSARGTSPTIQPGQQDRIPAALAELDQNKARILPAELIILSPTVPDALILSPIEG